MHDASSSAIGKTPPVAEPGDEELLERVRRGDAAAFDALVSRHSRRAFSLAFRLLGQREDAEDLVQDAFLAVLERIHSFERGRRFAPWFHRILFNRGMNARKARSLRSTEAIAPDAASPALSPAHAAERAELRERIGGAMAKLSETQHTVVQLFELEGFSGPEIGAMLDISPGTVRWHLHQARQTLRAALVTFGEKR